jgi:excisionase family DNA binding protein
MKQEPMVRLAVTLAEACSMTSLSIWTIRKAIKSGQLKTTKVGRRVLVPMRELERFVGAN